MGKGAGKGRGDDSSSSSDETDAKVKFLYMVICLLCGLVMIFALTVATLIYANQLSEEVTPIGVITPETAQSSTLGEPDLRAFDEPQEIRVNHENFQQGLSDTDIYCTSGVGVSNAEVPCQSSSILYYDTNRYVMRKNGAYACIFKSGELKDSQILETHYQINTHPPVISPPEQAPGTSLAIKNSKFTVTFSTDYPWTIEAATETIVFYTNHTTNHEGDITDCDEITNDDFLTCADYPRVPCWPPQVKPARAGAIYQYDPDSPPLMDSSVCIGAITKVRDMGIGVGMPSSSYSEMRYLVESVAEVRVEPCLQDAVDYTSYTNDILMWTSTPGASIKYTIDYDTTCLNLDALNVGTFLGSACDRVMAPDGSGGFTSPEGGQVTASVLPATSALALTYDQPFSIAHTARVVAIGQHEHAEIADSVLTGCDYEVRVANPSCTTEAGSGWMGVDSPLGSPQSPTVNTDVAIMRFLSPTQDSTVHFRYCNADWEDCTPYMDYNPEFPPKIYQTSQIEAWSSKTRLTQSEHIRCEYTVKAAPPIFTPPPTYGGTWEPKGSVDRTGVITAGVPAIDSFFVLGTSIMLSQWSDAQCDDDLASNTATWDGIYADEERGCRQARDFTLLYRMSEECCSLSTDEECSTAGGCTTVDDNGTPDDDSDDVSTTANDCGWTQYQPDGAHANGITLEGSKQICTKTVPTTNSIASNVRTADFFIYAEAPSFDKPSYSGYVNEMEFCLATTTPSAAVFYKPLRSTLLSNNKGAQPDRLISFSTAYPFDSSVLGSDTVEYTGAAAPDADAFATMTPACTVLRESTLISAATYKNLPADPATNTPGVQLAPSHRNHNNEYANTLNPEDIGMGTKSFYYVEVDTPVIYPDQRVGLDGSEPLHEGVGRAAAPVYGITADGTGDESAYWVADSDGNGNGEIFTSTEVTLSTASAYANGEAITGVEIKYAIEAYHCTDPDGSGPLTTEDSMLSCSAADRLLVDLAADAVSLCNMYDPDHTCNGDPGDTPFADAIFHGALVADTPVPQCTALAGIYDASAGTFVHSAACRSYLGTRYPKVARYVMTCNGLSDDDAGTLAPLTGCDFQTYSGDTDSKPVVDLTTFVYSYAKKANMEDSLVAQMEYEITVDGVALDVCGKPEGVPYYVGPTPVALSSPTEAAPLRAIAGPSCFGNSGGNGVVGSQPVTCNVDSSVTIKYFWSTEQYEATTAGEALPQPGAQSGSLAKRECGSSGVPGDCDGKQYDWLAGDPSSTLTRYEYAQNGRKIGGESDPRENACGTPLSWTKTSPSDATGVEQTFSAGCATPQDSAGVGEVHRPRLQQDLSVSWAEGDAFTVTEIGTLYAYAEKPGLSPSLLTACEYEIQATPPSWFQSGEICSEVSSGELGIPVCLSPALFGSGFIFLYSEADTQLHYNLRDNALADYVTRTSNSFDTWIQLVAGASTFFYSLKSFAVKAGMWDSVQVNQPFVVVTEVSRGAIASDNLPAEVTSNVCQGCSSDNILFGKPGQFWGAEYTTDPKGVVSVTLDFPGKWDEAVNECGAENTLTAQDTGTNYLVTTVYLAYPFIPDPDRGYARASSACADYEVEVQQTVRDTSCTAAGETSEYGGVCKEAGLRISWETGGETFSASGEQTNCIGTDAASGVDLGSKQKSEGCWRETVDADDEARNIRGTDSFTPPSPIRGTALKYTCNQLPFYLESWVVYGIPGAQLDVTSAASGTCTLGSGAAGIVDCAGNCVSTKNIGDGTCDAGQANTEAEADGSGGSWGTGAINSAGDYVSCTANGDRVDNIGVQAGEMLLPGGAVDATDDSDANCVANFNCVDFLYDKMDCFELDAGDGSIDLNQLFSTLYEDYDADQAAAAAAAAAAGGSADATGR